VSRWWLFPIAIIFTVRIVHTGPLPSTGFEKGLGPPSATAMQIQTHSHFLGLEATAIFLHSQDSAKQSLTIHKWSITFLKDEDSNATASLVNSSQRTSPAESSVCTGVSTNHPFTAHRSSTGNTSYLFLLWRKLYK